MIKYFDLQRISDSFEPELSETVVRVTRSGWYLQGEETRAFEEALVRELIKVSIASGAILQESKEGSQNTGFSPARTTDKIEAIYVLAGTITSSPGCDDTFYCQLWFFCQVCSSLQGN